MSEKELRDLLNEDMQYINKLEKTLDILKKKLKLYYSKNTKGKTINAILPIGVSDVNLLTKEEEELLEEVLHLQNEEIIQQVNEEDNKSEQWLLDGDCSVCRRKNYCSKDCNARIKAFEKNVSNSIGSIFLKRMLR